MINIKAEFSDNLTIRYFDSILPNCAWQNQDGFISPSKALSQIIRRNPQEVLLQPPFKYEGGLGVRQLKLHLLFGLIPTLFQQIKKVFSLIFNLTLAIKNSRDY